MPCNFLSGGASIFRRAKRSRASRKARVQDHGKDLDTTESALSPSCPSWRLNESRQVQECQCPARDHYPRSRSDVRDVAAVLQHRLKNVYVPHIIGQIIDSAEYWTRISVSKKQYVPVCECCPCVTYLNAGPVVGQGPSPIRKVEISLTIKDLARHVDPETSRWRWQEHDQDDQARQIEPTLCRKEVHPNVSRSRSLPK